MGFITDEAREAERQRRQMMAPDPMAVAPDGLGSPDGLWFVGRLQEIVARAVCDRGYYETEAGVPWSQDQLAARQVAKMVEEIGELSEQVAQRVTGPLLWEFLVRTQVGPAAGREFDLEHQWVTATVLDVGAAASELADVAITAYTMADALGVDLERLVIEKVTRDIERGVRT